MRPRTITRFIFSFLLRGSWVVRAGVVGSRRLRRAARVIECRTQQASPHLESTSRLGGIRHGVFDREVAEISALFLVDGTHQQRTTLRVPQLHEQREIVW